MKFFSQTFFLCFFICVPCLLLDPISAAKFRRNGNDSGILGGNVRERRIRSSDENEHGEKDGDDVILSGTGRINLTLIYEVLEFEICDNCAGTSRVCYESLNGWEDSEATGSCSDSNSCEFKVKDVGDGIKFNTFEVFKDEFIRTADGSCLSTMMKFPKAHVLPNQNYKSCDPKMDDNKMIKLFVDIDPECSIKVKNARIYVPEVTLKVPSTKSPSKRISETSSFPIWGYIIIAVGIIVLIVILIICFIAYHLYKTHKPSKPIPPNADEIKSKPTASNAKVAIVETPTNQNLNLAKVEPNMNNENKSKKNQKKDKKKKTKIHERTTTEDIPTVSQQESVASISSKQLSPLPPPNPAACYPVVNRIIPRSMKSTKNDSLNEKDESVMMESESVKF
uniref:Uncharacterized protein n=1 Tax=Panagrolaimus davidi TaxID=227884 RepID=A0A914PDG4_9BILA